MVQFPPFPSLTYEFSQGYPACAGWVVPFGYLRITVCLPLPEAYRSLPRPSSASDAKASAMHPYYLDTFSCFRRNFLLFSMCFINRIFVKELYFQPLTKQQLNTCRCFLRRISNLFFFTERENQSQTCDTEITAETCLPYP